MSNPYYPIKTPSVIAAGVWLTFAMFGTSGLFAQNPLASSTVLFQIVLTTVLIATCLHLLMVYNFAFNTWFNQDQVPEAAYLPLKVLAWGAPSIFAAFTGMLAAAATSYFVKFGLLVGTWFILIPLTNVIWIASLIIHIPWFLVKYVWIILGRPKNGDADWLETSSKTSKSSSPNTSAVEGAHSKDQAQKQESSKDARYEFEWRSPTMKFGDLAGMAELKGELETAIQPFTSYKDRGPVADRNGILLSGPPGNGKTAFAQAIAGQLGLPFVKISGVDISSKWVNESPSVLKSLFAQAAEQPCVVFIDEMDSVAKDRGNNSMHEEDKKLTTALLTLIDDARKNHIVLVAATNYVDNLDKAVIRDGRFDYRIEVPFPDLDARIGILTGMLAKFKVAADTATVQYVAELWERRSVAFIEATVKRIRDNGRGPGSAPASVEDFKKASREASRRQGNIPKGGAKLSELALTSSVRREATSLVYRLLNWERIAEQGGEPPSGVLLYGPPGTGKTSFVRALARELTYWHVFEVNATDVLNDPRKFKTVLEMAADHRPAIVFIDEADELLRNRAHSSSAGATNEILKCMDGLMGKVPEVVFMAATNNPEAIDAAALRGGRFAEKIFMGLLEGEDLVEFLKKDFASKTKVRFAPDLNPHSLASRLGQVSPADALTILRKAINYTFDASADARPVSMKDIEAAIDVIQG